MALTAQQTATKVNELKKIFSDNGWQPLPAEKSSLPASVEVAGYSKGSYMVYLIADTKNGGWGLLTMTSSQDALSDLWRSIAQGGT